MMSLLQGRAIIFWTHKSRLDGGQCWIEPLTRRSVGDRLFPAYWWRRLAQVVRTSHPILLVERRRKPPYGRKAMAAVLENLPREARDAAPSGGQIAVLSDGKLYALQNSFALDGRVSSYPESARGFSVANCYLLKQDDAAMLIDTGFGKDEPVIREQIESLIPPGLPLSLFPLRLNEFMSINNVESFAGHFNVEQCYTSNIDAALWFDFGAKVDGRSILESMPVVAVTRSDTIQIGKKGRPIDVMQAPIRLIATRWLYDGATRTLFSSDLFTHLWRDRPDGPWVVTDDDDTTTTRDIRSFMLNTRYWWLEGAPTDSIRRGIDAVFDKYDIETIAPGYGCILRGRKLVARHYRMLDEFLKACDKSVAVSRYVSRDEER
jgi:hypothetical protein